MIANGRAPWLRARHGPRREASPDPESAAHKEEGTIDLRRQQRSPLRRTLALASSTRLGVPGLTLKPETSSMIRCSKRCRDPLLVRGSRSSASLSLTSMAKTLYLIETRARQHYTCSACARPIPRGSPYFRHEPHPFARQFRGEQRSHWCYECITATPGGVRDQLGRLWIKPASLARVHSKQLSLELATVEIIRVGKLLSTRLAEDPSLIHGISPAQFEEFLCDRLAAMGFEPKRVGSTFSKDGGIDVVFWPRERGAFPFLGAAQVKHHRDPAKKEGPGTVRDFAGALGGHPFNAALLVTNTSFSFDAEWFAREHAKLILSLIHI